MEPMQASLDPDRVFSRGTLQLMRASSASNPACMRPRPSAALKPGLCLLCTLAACLKLSSVSACSDRQRLLGDAI